VAAVEMALADDLSLIFEAVPGVDPLAELFSGYVLQVADTDVLSELKALRGVLIARVGEVRPAAAPTVEIRHGTDIQSIDLASLRTVWQAPLDW